MDCLKVVENMKVSDEAFKEAVNILKRLHNMSTDDLIVAFNSDKVEGVLDKYSYHDIIRRLGVLDSMNDIELCPYCGGTEIILVGNDGDGYAYTCDYNKGGCGGSSGYRRTIEEAKEAWNCRAKL